MSIEPASVSSPVVRDNDKGLELGAWGGVQGSATGRKDGRQFSSFWDKAVHGAQRLLGFEKQGSAVSEGEEESAESETPRSAKEVSGNGDYALRTAPGFGNSGLGRLSLSMKRERLNDLIAFSPSRPEFDSRPEVDVSVANGPRMEPREREGRGEAKIESEALSEPSQEAKGAPEQPSKSEPKTDSERKAQDADVSEEKSDSADESAKSADAESRLLSQRPLMGNTPSFGTSLGADNKEVAGVSERVGINPAMQEETMNALPTAPAPETTESLPSAIAGGQAVVGEKPLGSPDSQGVRGGNSVAELARQTKGDGEAISSLAKSGEFKTVPDSQSKAPEGPVSELNLRPLGKEEPLVDFEKAKLAMGEGADKAKAAAAMGRQAKVSTSVSSPAATGSSVAQPQGESPSLSEPNTSESDAAALRTAEQRLSKLGAPKIPQAQVKGTEAARAVGVAHSLQNAENSASETSTTRRSEVQAFQESIRESQSSDARGVQARPQANRSRSASPSSPTTATGATGAAGVAAGKNASGLNAQSQQGNAFGNAGKQESFEQQMMARDAAPKASAPQAKSDGTSAFQVSGSQSATAPKTEFAAKAQPTSYASKTLEEVKEVYAALTKSVERLVSGKGETLSIRINFEQGGTMAIRVTMEGGQVNTSMQTDLPGLEGLIKSNWSELANEWNQKGLKLNLPQFSQPEGEGSRDGNSMSFAQREGQAQGGSRQDPNGRQGGGFARSSSASVETETAASGLLRDEVISDQELKTYA